MKDVEAGQELGVVKVVCLEACLAVADCGRGELGSVVVDHHMAWAVLPGKVEVADNLVGGTAAVEEIAVEGIVVEGIVVEDIDRASPVVEADMQLAGYKAVGKLVAAARKNLENKHHNSHLVVEHKP